MNEQTLGQITCPICGDDCDLKLTKKGKAYVNCGGCGSQTFARSPVADSKLRARLKQAEQVKEPAEKPAPAVTVTRHSSDGQTERTIFDILGGLGK